MVILFFFLFFFYKSMLTRQRDAFVHYHNETLPLAITPSSKPERHTQKKLTKSMMVIITIIIMTYF